MFNPIPVRLGAVDEKSAKQLVFGRAGLVQAFWKQIDAGSLRLVAERRMGKTWMLRRAFAEAPDWAIPVFFDAQNYTGIADFVLDLNKTLHENNCLPDGWHKTAVDWFRRWTHRMQGQKVTNEVEVPLLESSTSILEGTCKEFVRHNSGKRVMLAIDEFPFLLDKLVKANKHNEAIDLLDTFRRLRQSLPDFRVVFCGSLGLHIVMEKLTERGYTGRPVNDMPPFEVPPLGMSDAIELAGGLLAGRKLVSTNETEVAKSVASAGSCVPFYIQHIVSWMSQQDVSPWTPDAAASAVERLFDAPNDPAEFRYYDDRLDQYYPEDIVSKARAILFQLAHHDDGVAFDTLINGLRHSPKCIETDEHGALRVLETLRDDHYLVSEGTRWRFKLPIVRRWWRHTRGGH